MAQKKLQRFKAINSFSNVLQYPENMKGQWKNIFKNESPIILELACGKAEYTVELAKKYKDKNYIGIDIKGNRLYVGAKKCIDEKINNAAFLRTQIDKIDTYFDACEVDEIWITFPDPQLRKSKAKKRLTHPKFLQLYKNILQPEGRIHLKTDSIHLYAYTKKVIEFYALNTVSDLADLYNSETIDEDLKILTYYESLNISKSPGIYYLCFTLTKQFMKTNEKISDLIIEQELSEV